MPQVFLDVAEPHAGQQKVIDEAGQYNCVRPGRRWGKTEVAVELARRVLLAGQPVGWFAPEAKYHTEGWERVLDSMRALLLPAGKGGTDKSTGIWTARFITGGLFHCHSLHNNNDAGRSQKYARIIVDEAGLCRHLLDWWNMAGQATLLDLNGDAFFFGTPKLSGRGFNQLYDRGGKSKFPDWRSFKGRTVENIYLRNVRAWVAARSKEMPDWQAAQEFDGEPADSVQAFFGEKLVNAYKAEHCTEPVLRGSIDIPLRYQGERDAILTEGSGDKIRFREDEKGSWRFWFDVDRRGRPEIKTTAVCLGADIGCGVGASNSVISVGDSDTGQKFAEYASPGDSPEDLARIAVAFCWWISDRDHPPRVNFEANGPGEQFVKIMRQLEYPNLHTRRKTPVKVKNSSAEEYGWWNTPGAKYTLFSEYKDALRTSAVINPSEAGLDECLEYSLDEKNHVFHERELAEVDDETGAKIPHGDRVVADALLHQAMQANPVSAADNPDPPEGSFAARQRQEEIEEAAREAARW